jgi:hypothetical protein
MVHWIAVGYLTESIADISTTSIDDFLDDSASVGLIVTSPMSHNRPR